jgi:hypothetical protein
MRLHAEAKHQQVGFYHKELVQDSEISNLDLVNITDKQPFASAETQSIKAN